MIENGEVYTDRIYPKEEAMANESDSNYTWVRAKDEFKKESGFSLFKDMEKSSVYFQDISQG